MTATAPNPQAGHPLGAARPLGPVLDVVVPVRDEQVDLEPCVRRLHAHLRRHVPYSFRITIADNASADATPTIAAALAAELPEVVAVRLDQPGRGLALRSAWSASDADVLAYLDVDLSTDLAALLPLVAPLISGHSDLAIGTRLARGARVVRGARREVVSRCYNYILRGALAARFSDAQCGFKAIRADVAGRLLPLVEDTGWFFDTELLVLAQRAGLRIHEVPVDWVDDPDSTVDILATALADLRGVARLGRALLAGRLPIALLRHEFGRDRLPAGPSGGGLLPGVGGLLARPSAGAPGVPAQPIPAGHSGGGRLPGVGGLPACPSAGSPGVPADPVVAGHSGGGRLPGQSGGGRLSGVGGLLAFPSAGSPGVSADPVVAGQFRGGRLPGVGGPVGVPGVPADPPGVAAGLAGVPAGLAGQAARFAVVGVASTLAYLVLFLLLRNGMGAQAANLAALLITAVANTAANRRVTFAVRGPRHAARHQLQGLAVFALGLGLTSGALGLLGLVAARPDRALELAALVAANGLAAVVRFVLLRAWVFRARR